MEVYFTIEGRKKDLPFYGVAMGVGTIKGNTMEEVIEKAKEIAKNPLKYFLGNEKYRAAYPLPIRVSILIKGEGRYSITETGIVTKPKHK